MKGRNILTKILMVALAVSIVFAGGFTQKAIAEEKRNQDSFLNSLFANGGLLGGILPEGTDVDAIVNDAVTQLNQAGTEISSALGEVGNAIQNELSKIDTTELEKTLNQAKGELSVMIDGALTDVRNALSKNGKEYDLNTLDGYASALLSSILGTSNVNYADLDKLLDTVNIMREAENQYILERNAKSFEPSDVQIVTNSCIYTDESEHDPLRIISCMIQSNYKMNDKKQLLQAGYAMDIVLFKHKVDAEGKYPIVEATFAEDGEKYLPSIQAMCDEVGEPIEDCLFDIEFGTISQMYDLVKYMDEHKDITGIEYSGEILTRDELETLYYLALGEMF